MKNDNSIGIVEILQIIVTLVGFILMLSILFALQNPEDQLSRFIMGYVSLPFVLVWEFLWGGGFVWVVSLLLILIFLVLAFFALLPIYQKLDEIKEELKRRKI